MAVYTHLNHDKIAEFLAAYEVGELQSFEGITAGIENTNYHVFTTSGRYVLTIFEKRVDPRDLPFFFAFMNHLAKEKINVPRALADQTGKILQTIDGKKAVLISHLDGAGVLAGEINPVLCAEMGQLLAQLHVGSISFESSRPNTMGLPAWKKIFDKVKSRLNEIDEELEGLLRGQLLEFENMPQPSLPRAVVHADLFPDNVFMRDGHVDSVIDFYFSCNDFLGYDLALTINAWCFDADGNCDHERLASLLEHYEMIRPMARDEKRHMNLFLRMAAVRILLTRAHDWLFRDPNALVVTKNPVEYIRILKYHRDHHVIG